MYFADTGVLCHLLGFRAPADLLAHPMWGAVWENFVISEIRKRLLDTGKPPALWFWRTASGDEVDLLIETGPERFIALECKTAQQVTSDSLKGIRRAAHEYGSNAIVRARVVCRTETAYPLDPSVDARAVPVGDAIDEAAGLV